MSGLVRARELASRGEDVALLESSSRVGGLVRTEEKDGFLLELGPNTVRPTAELWRLVEDLGLRDEAVLADPKLPRYVFWKGALHPLPMSPGALARTRLLSLGGKLKLLAEPLASRGEDPEESLHSFFSRRLGREVAERFVEPFVGGIFAGSSRSLAVAAAFPTLDRWEKSHGSLLAGALLELRRRPKSSGTRPPRGLLSFRDGLRRLPEAIAAKLGKSLELSTRVLGLKPGPDGSWLLATEQGPRTAGHVVLATPAREAARLIEPFAPEGAAALGEIPHPFLAVVHLAWTTAELARPLHGFGHLTVPDPTRRILGAVWSSGLFDGRSPAGQTLVTAFLGGERDPKAAELAEDEIEAVAGQEVGEAIGARSRPRVVLLTRYARSIPQYVAGHSARMNTLSRTEERFPGLTFLGNYRGGISVGDVVRQALIPGR